MAGRSASHRGRRLFGAAALNLSLVVATLVGVSPLARAAEPHNSATSSVAPKMSNCPGGMTSADDANVRVWACDDGSGATVDETFALLDIEDLYGPMSSFMSHAPLPDIGGVAGGGDTRIDIYLMNPGRSLTREGFKDNLGTDLGHMDGDNLQGTASSGYILLQRALLEDNPTDFQSVVAHEFFHLLEVAYNDASTCSKYWFTEAAAKWAEWYFVPDAAADEVYPWFTYRFQTSPGMSLFNPGTRTPYSDFIWAMYMQQEHGAASIASAWKAMAGVSGCAGLNAAVDAQVSFAANFKHFAVENFDNMLPDFHTGVKAWPQCSTCEHYQSLAPLVGTAPPFPLVPPTTSFHQVAGPTYPWKTTVSKVNLPQLSAEYDDVSVSAGSSVEFDFSHLSNPSDLDVSLIAGDNSPGNGGWVVVPVTGTDEKVCVAADGAQVSDFTVVLDNHDEGPPAQITGSYTVTARATCALSLAGTLSVTSSSSGSGVKTTTKATMRVKLKSSAQGWVSFPPSTGSYSGTYKQTGPDSCPDSTYVINAKGSGKMKPSDLAVTAYQEAYSTAPYIGAPVLVTEMAQGTKTSPCGDGTTIEPLVAGYQCPVSDSSSLYGALQGSYSGSDDAVVFNCSSSFPLFGSTYDTTVSGTLTATGVVPCGLWQPDFCSLPGSVGNRGYAPKLR